MVNKVKTGFKSPSNFNMNGVDLVVEPITTGIVASWAITNLLIPFLINNFSNFTYEKIKEKLNTLSEDEVKMDEVIQSIQSAKTFKEQLRLVAMNSLQVYGKIWDRNQMELANLFTDNDFLYNFEGWFISFESSEEGNSYKDYILSHISDAIDDAEFASKLISVLGNVLLQHPTLTKWRDNIQHGRLHEDVKLMHEDIKEIKQKLEFNSQASVEEALASVFKPRLDEIGELINDFKIVSAKEAIEKLQSEAWDKANNDIRYDILRLKGCIANRTNQEADCSTFFIQAFELNPSNPKAQANAALGYCLRGENTMARALIEEAIQKLKYTLSFYVTYIYILEKERLPPDRIIELLPDYAFDDADVCYRLGFSFQDAQDYNNALTWFGKSYRKDESNFVYCAAYSAMLLNSVVVDSRVPILNYLTHEYKATLEEALELAKRAYEAVIEKEMVSSFSYIFMNLSVTCDILGETEEAISILDKGIELCGSSRDFLFKKAMLCHKLGQHEDALIVGRELLEKDESVHFKITFIETLMANGRLVEAKDLGEVTKKTCDLSDNELIMLNSLLIKIFMQNHEFGRCEIILAEQSNRNSQHASFLTDAMTFYFKTGNESMTSEVLQKIKFCDVSAFNLLDKMQLAICLGQFGFFKHAIKVFDVFAPTGAPNKALEMLLDSLWNEQQLKRVAELVDSIIESYGLIKPYVLYKIALLEKARDLPKCKELCSQLAESNPDDFDNLLHIAMIDFQFDDYDAVNAFLEKKLFSNAIGEDEALRYFSLLRLMDEEERMIDECFEYIDNNPNCPRIMEFYVSSVLMSQNHSFFKPRVVSLDCIVDLVKKESNEKQTFTVVSEDDANLSKGFIPVSDSFASNLLAKKVGDEVIKTSLKDEVFVIDDIRSKYLFKCHELMKNFIPSPRENQSVFKFQLNPPEKGEASIEDFRPILEQIDDLKKRTDCAFKLYKETQFPISFIAKCLGYECISVYNTLTQMKNMFFRASIGTREDFQLNLGDSPSVVLDISFILTLFLLDIQDEFLTIFPTPIVARAVVDEFRIFIERLSLSNRDHLVMSKQENNYASHDVSKDVFDKEVSYYQKIVSWIEKNCETSSCEEVFELEGERKSFFSKALSDSAIHTILTSKNRTLLSDDAGLRSIAIEDGVNTSWIQPILLYILNNGRISSDKYNSLISILIRNNFSFISVNADILMKTVEDPTDLYTYEKALKLLSHSIQSLPISTIFLCQLYLSNDIINEYKTVIAHMLLGKVIPKIKSLDFIAKLIKNINVGLLMSPIVAKELENTIGFWYETNLRNGDIIIN